MFWNVFILIISFLSAFFLTPYFARLALKCDVVDKPSHRKVHKKILPLWGGLTLGSSFLITFIILFIISFLASLFSVKQAFFSDILTWRNFLLGRQFLGVVFAGVVVVGVGVADDKWGLPPKVKLLGQLLACTVLLYFGVRVFSLTIPFTHFSISLFPVIGGFFTLAWMLLLMNAFNFIDGLDGLASGVAVIVAMIFFIILINSIPHATTLFTRRSLILASYLSIFVIGSTLAFLIFNFHPAKVFLGDSGSMFLGFMLASITIIGALKSAAALAIFIPVIVIGIPIFDAVYVIVKRIRAGLPVSKADKGHLHHHLLALGFTHRQVVLILYFLSAVLGGISLLLAKYH